MMRWRSGNSANDSLRLRRVVLAGVLLLVGAVAAGCAVGDDDSGARKAPVPTATATVDDDVDVVVPKEDTPAAERTPQQVREAIATGRSLDQLAAVFAPVSARINFIVAADTLRRDAIETKADEDVLRERAGAVRVEVRRMRPLLVTAQRGLGRFVPTRPAVRRVQAELVAAVTARLRALDRLEAVLDAEGDDLADGDVERLDEEFRIAWDASVRSTREATTAGQTLRASLGLDPAPEEALR